MHCIFCTFGFFFPLSSWFYKRSGSAPFETRHIIIIAKKACLVKLASLTVHQKLSLLEISYRDKICAFVFSVLFKGIKPMFRLHKF